MRRIDSGALVFVNREDELAILQSLVPPACTESSLLIIKAPPGFGKSALTNRLIDWLNTSEISIETAVVDPSIRMKSGDARIHGGFFIQRFAEELSASASAGKHASLHSFLADRRWRTAGEKKIADLFRRYPSLTAFYGDAVEYAERLFATGQYAAESILTSDTRDAIMLCAEYVDHICRENAIVAIIREAQHIDHQSLRYILQLNRNMPFQHLFIEYTAQDDFDPDHEKLILRELDGHSGAYILELVPLEREHLEQLIRDHVDPDFALTSDYYLKWNGNIRSVIEMKYRTVIHRKLQSGRDLSLPLSDFTGQLGKHVDELDRWQKILITIIRCHVEAIDRRTLLSVASQLDKYTTSGRWDQALRELMSKHRFVEQNRDTLRIQNEDVSVAIDDSPEFIRLLALSRKSLRDYYLSVLDDGNFSVAGMPVAIRQALTLCAKTHDTTSMLDIVRRLSADIRRANDQSIYVDAVIHAVTDETELFQQERTALSDWAAALAYDTCDFPRAAQVLTMGPTADPYRAAMLACCLQEIGMHQQALALVGDQRQPIWESVNAQLAADLIHFLILRDLGDVSRARALLDSILSTAGFELSGLYGYALRFSESVNEFPRCTADVLASARWFDRFGLIKSQGYSELAAAMHLARQGDGAQALELIEHAGRHLLDQVRDQHMVFNNQAAVAMLVSEVDFPLCEEWLVRAMRTSRDDYSDVTILNNLAIVHLKCGRLEEAIDCVERILVILRAPMFADRDIFWEVAFTAMSVFERAGDGRRASLMRSLPPRPPIVYEEYWDYRFGMRSDIDEKYRYLIRFDYHPLFLSHWLIDREGLELLREGSPQ